MYAILHQHFESKLRLLKILNPQKLDCFYSIYKDKKFCDLKPVGKLEYLDTKIPKIDSIYFTKRNFTLVVKQLLDEMRIYGIKHVDLRLGLELGTWKGIDIVVARRVFDKLIANSYQDCSIAFIAALNLPKGEKKLINDLKLLSDKKVISTIAGIDINLFEEDLDLLMKYKTEISDVRRRYGKKINIHLGEFTSNEFNKKVLSEFIPNRVGHGIKMLGDKDLEGFIKYNNICLDICPTSNQLLGLVDWSKENPIIYALENDILVSVNTDDPILFDTNIDKEIGRARLSENEVKRLNENSFRCSYA